MRSFNDYSIRNVISEPKSDIKTEKTGKYYDRNNKGNRKQLNGYKSNLDDI